MKKSIQAGLIAAGNGSRFRKAGFEMPKPMIEVGARPLVWWVFQQFKEAGIERLAAIFNSANCAICSDYIKKEFPGMEMDFRCRDTRTSAESFMDVLSRASDSRILITTTDSIYRPGALKALLKFACTLPEDAMVLGITSFVDDEKPLYADVFDNHLIRSVGEKETRYVTNGVYLMPSKSYLLGKDREFTALRKFLAFLIERGVRCHGFDLGKSIDVDRPEDIIAAEEFIKTFS